MHKILFSIIFLSAFSFYAQTLSDKWVLVSQESNHKIFVDTTTIKTFEDKISVLSFIFYSQPKFIESIQKEAFSLKTQVLFSLSSQQYSTIGSLYYDDKLKILGESSTPGLTFDTQTTNISIDSSKSIKGIYDFCIKYINRNEQIVYENEIRNKNNKTREILERIANGDSIKNLKTEPLKENQKNISISPKTVKDTSVRVISENNNTATKVLSSIANKKINEENSVESNPKDNIYFDGNKYSIQISSWKNKSKAEYEANRLKGIGFNSFIVEALVSLKRGKWYRVRVGYYNSIEEAEEQQKKLR